MDDKARENYTENFRKDELVDVIDKLQKENALLKEQLIKADNEIERLAQVNAALIIKNNELKQDKERLDLLDNCNSEFNKRCGSNYGWKVDWNHNRIAIVDTGIPKTDVRTAVDKFKARLSMEGRSEQLRKERESE